jgi:DNA modification methylase
MSAPAKNKLYYGDNLEVMRQYIPDESVDLVYLDPPFNSNRSYNVIFGKNQTVKDAAAAQIQAFNDAWRWTPVTEGQYERYAVGGELPERVGDALTASGLSWARTTLWLTSSTWHRGLCSFTGY